MPVFKANLKIGYGSITQGLAQVRAAMSSLRRIATPGQVPMPSKVDTSSMMNDLKKLESLRNVMKMPISAPPAMPHMPQAFIPGGVAAKALGIPRFPHLEGISNITKVGRKQLETGFENLSKAFNAKDLSLFRRSFVSIREVLSNSAGRWEKTRPIMLGIYSAMKRHVVAVDKQNKATENLTKIEKEVAATLLKEARLRKKAFSTGMMGAMPFGIGDIYKKFQQSRERKAELGQFFGAQQAAGAPIGGLAKGFAMLQAGAGPVLAIASAVKDLALGFVKLAGATVGFGINLAKLPLNVVMSIHRVIRSLTFSFLMFVHVFQRFFSKAFETVKTVQVATLVSSGSLKEFAGNMVNVIDLSIKYAVKTEDIAKGLVKVSKAGFSSSGAMKILSASMAYATIFQAELNTVLDQTITVLRAFDLSAEQSTEVTKKLYLAATQSNLSVGDLSTSLGYAAGAAEAAGVSLDHALAALMAFKDAGLRASRAGMAFRTGIAGLQKAIGAAAGQTMNLDEAVKVLNVDWEKLGKDGMSLTDVFEEFHKVLGDGVSLQEKMAMRAIFGTRYYSYWITLIKKGDATLERHLAILKKGVDLDKVALEMSSSFVGAIMILQNVWSAFKVSVLSEVSGPLEGIIDSMGNLTTVAENFGLALGRIAKEQVIQRIVDAFKAITTTKGMEKVSVWLDKVSAKVNFWSGELIKAGGSWIKNVIGKDAAEGALGILDIIGMIAVESMKISEVISQAFTGFAKEPERFMKIVEDISRFLTHTVPTALKAIATIASWVMGVIGAGGTKAGARIRAELDVLYGEGKKELDAITSGISNKAKDAITDLKVQIKTVRNELDAATPGMLTGWFRNLQGILHSAPKMERDAQGNIRLIEAVPKADQLAITLEELEAMFARLTVVAGTLVDKVDDAKAAAALANQ